MARWNAISSVVRRAYRNIGGRRSQYQVEFLRQAYEAGYERGFASGRSLWDGLKRIQKIKDKRMEVIQEPHDHFSRSCCEGSHMTTLAVPVVRVANKLGAAVEVEIPDSLSLEEELGDRVFRVMTADDGDKRIVWNSGILQQIRDAKKMFEDLVDRGLVPYNVGEDGKATDQVMREFDPLAEEVLFLPVAMVAGG